MGCFFGCRLIRPASRTGLRSRASWRAASPHILDSTERVSFDVADPLMAATAQVTVHRPGGELADGQAGPGTA